MGTVGIILYNILYETLYNVYFFENIIIFFFSRHIPWYYYHESEKTSSNTRMIAILTLSFVSFHTFHTTQHQDQEIPDQQHPIEFGSMYFLDSKRQKSIW